MQSPVKIKPKLLSKQMVLEHVFKPGELTCHCCKKVRPKSRFSAKALINLHELATIKTAYEKAAYIRKFYGKIRCNDCSSYKRRPNLRCYSCKTIWSSINFTPEQIDKGHKGLCKGCTVYTKEDLKLPEAESSEYEIRLSKDSSVPIQSENDITTQELFPVNNNELNCNQHETIDLTIDRKNDYLKNNMCTICNSKCSIHLCCRDCKNTMILVKFPRDQRDKGNKASCNSCTKKSQENALSKLNSSDAIDLEVSDKNIEATNNICTICDLICTKHLYCYSCNNLMRIKWFSQFQRTLMDKARCTKCLNREKKKKRLEIAKSNSSGLRVNNDSCSICKSSCSIHIYCCACLKTKSVECYSVNQRDNKSNAICYDCEDNSQKIIEIYSDSEKSNITNPFNLVNSLEMSSQMQEIQTSNSVLVSKDNSSFINIHQDDAQLKDKEQAHSNICEPISIPIFNKNVYSLSQLIGRKNPPVFNNIYTPFEIPEEYKAEVHDEVDMNENTTPFEDLLLLNNDSAYDQYNSQKAPNDPSDIKEYVRQFVDSIYNQSLDQ